MKFAMLAGLVAVLTLGMAVGASAQALPWKAGDSAAPAAGTPAPGAPAPAPGAPVPAAPTPAGGDLATNPKYAGAVKPIEETLKAAAKVMELYDKEMAKPEKERSVEKASNFKLNAAGMYVKAALQAKMAAGRFSKAEEKTPILDTYGKPNIDKAVGIYMDMAAAAEAKKDFRTALAYYKKVLDIDPQNTQAQEAGKKLVADHPELAKAGKAGPGGGGSGNVNDPTAVPDPSMQKTWKQNPTGAKDYGHIGR